MGALWAIAVKDIRLLIRDRAGMFFTFIFPLIVAVFFGSIFGSGGKPGPISVLVVDADRTEGSEAFINQMAEGGDFALATLAWSGEKSTREAAIDAVRTGDFAACLIIPKGFGAARAAPFSGERMTVELAIDPSRKATAGMLEGILTKYGFMQMQQGFANPEKMRTMARDSLAKIKADAELDPARKKVFDTFFGNLDAMLATIPPDEDKSAAKPDTTSTNPDTTAAKPETGNPANKDAATPPSTSTKSSGFNWQPLTITQTPIVIEQRGPSNSYEITFPQGIIWGVMGCTLGFAISLILERTRGTLIRLRAAPLRAWQILGGKGLACFLTTMAVACTLMLIGVVVFKIRPQSPIKVAAAIACTSICFVGIMMLLATFSKTERGGNGLGWGVLMLFSMIGGGMIPLEFLPPWMAPLSNFSPIKWSIKAMEGGIWRGLSWTEMATPCAILLAIGVIGFAVGMKVLGDAERA